MLVFNIFVTIINRFSTERVGLILTLQERYSCILDLVRVQWVRILIFTLVFFLIDTKHWINENIYAKLKWFFYFLNYNLAEKFP